MGYNDQRQGSFGPIPVKVGDVLEVTIEAVGAKGDGIAKKDGFVLFVPGVKEGERIKIRVTKVLRKVGFAEKAGSDEATSSDNENVPSEENSSSEEEPGEEDSEDFGDEGN